MANQFSSKDKFGNIFTVVGMKDKKGNGFPKGFVELKGGFYKLELCPSKKDGTDNWVRVTAIKKDQQNQRV